MDLSKKKFWFKLKELFSNELSEYISINGDYTYI